MGMIDGNLVDFLRIVLIYPSCKRSKQRNTHPAPLRIFRASGRCTAEDAIVLVSEVSDTILHNGHISIVLFEHLAQVFLLLLTSYEDKELRCTLLSTTDID